MEGETESDLVIAPQVAGKGAAAEAPAVDFDDNSLAKTDSESPEDPNDRKKPEHSTESRVHDQIEVRTEDKTVIKDGSEVASYFGKPFVFEHTPVGFAMGLAAQSIEGLAWYVKATLVEECEGRGCTDKPKSRLSHPPSPSICAAGITALSSTPTLSDDSLTDVSTASKCSSALTMSSVARSLLPARRRLRLDPSSYLYFPYQAKNEEEDTVETMALVQAAEKALQLRGNDHNSLTKPTDAKSGPEYFLSRAYRGLEINSDNTLPEPYIVGRSGKASGYKHE